MANEIAVAEPPAKEEAKPKIDPDLERTLKDLGMIVENDKPKPLPTHLPGRNTLGDEVKANNEKRLVEEEEAKAKPEEEKKEEPAAPAIEEKKVEPPAVTPKVTVKKTTEEYLQRLIDKRVADTLAKLPPPPPANEQPKPETFEDAYEKSLGDIEQEELKFARYAAGKDANLKEYPKQLVDYYKKVDAYTERSRKEDPDRTFDETDSEWNKWRTENQPKIPRVTYRKLEREQLMEEAESRAEAKYRTEFAKIERRQELLEKRPAIEKTVNEFERSLSDVLETDQEGDEAPVAPIAKRAKEVGWGKAVEEDPLFAPIVQRVTHIANRLGAEFLDLVSGTKEPDLANNEQHRWLSKFVSDQGAEFASKGGDATLRDGRQFLPRHQYYDVARNNPEQASRHWTWTDADILQRIALDAKASAARLIKIEQDKLAKAGFERRKPEPAKKEIPKQEKKPVDEHEKNGSPKAPASVAPGVSQPAKITGPASGMTTEEVAILIPGWKPG